MFPYHHGNNGAVAFADSFLDRCDQFLAITGNYWYDSTAASLYSHWLPKMVHLDLAVDRRDFPPVKTNFNPPGRRRFVFVGSGGWTKNPAYLSAIAKAMPESSIGWIGTNRQNAIPGVTALGYQDFTTACARRMISSFDFMITVSAADANPATILEAMAWGLIPISTPQSGYVGYPGIVNVPLDDVEVSVGILRALQAVPSLALEEMQELNWRALDEHFNWDRFAQQVIDSIESEACSQIGNVPALRRLRIRYLAVKRDVLGFPARLGRNVLAGLRSIHGAPDRPEEMPSRLAECRKAAVGSPRPISTTKASQRRHGRREPT
jgi:glycosyltransferase involved in cell wall biosynthesis